MGSLLSFRESQKGDETRHQRRFVNGGHPRQGVKTRHCSYPIQAARRTARDRMRDARQRAMGVRDVKT